MSNYLPKHRIFGRLLGSQSSGGFVWRRKKSGKNGRGTIWKAAMTSIGHAGGLICIWIIIGIAVPSLLRMPGRSRWPDGWSLWCFGYQKNSTTYGLGSVSNNVLQPGMWSGAAFHKSVSGGGGSFQGVGNTHLSLKVERHKWRGLFQRSLSPKSNIPALLKVEKQTKCVLLFYSTLTNLPYIQSFICMSNLDLHHPQGEKIHQPQKNRSNLAQKICSTLVSLPRLVIVSHPALA